LLVDRFFQLRSPVAKAVLRAFRINGLANQESMNFYLIPRADGDANILSSLKDNTYYKVRGKIQRASLTGPNPRCNFLVEQIEAVPDAPLKPSDLAGRIANLEGVAIAKGVVEIHGEKASLSG
jgi:hypothetical protein